nr:MAG TPA: hypothetical protein [Caudoviricetes sp.]
MDAAAIAMQESIDYSIRISCIARPKKSRRLFSSPRVLRHSPSSSSGMARTSSASFFSKGPASHEKMTSSLSGSVALLTSRSKRAMFAACFSSSVFASAVLLYASATPLRSRARSIRRALKRSPPLSFLMFVSSLLGLLGVEDFEGRRLGVFRVIMARERDLNGALFAVLRVKAQVGGRNGVEDGDDHRVIASAQTPDKGNAALVVFIFHAILGDDSGVALRGGGVGGGRSQRKFKRLHRGLLKGDLQRGAPRIQNVVAFGVLGHTVDLQIVAVLGGRESAASGRRAEQLVALFDAVERIGAGDIALGKDTRAKQQPLLGLGRLAGDPFLVEHFLSSHSHKIEGDKADADSFVRLFVVVHAAGVEIIHQLIRAKRKALKLTQEGVCDIVHLGLGGVSGHGAGQRPMESAVRDPDGGRVADARVASFPAVSAEYVLCAGDFCQLLTDSPLEELQQRVTRCHGVQSPRLLSAPKPDSRLRWLTGNVLRCVECRQCFPLRQ